VYWSAGDLAEVPPAVVTVTSTVPAPSAGAVATICVAVSEVMVAATEPKSATVAPERLVPVMVTEFVPEVGPEEGETAVTAGGVT